MAHNNKRKLTVSEWVNSLTSEQMGRIYDVIDGPIPEDLKSISDDDLMAELTGGAK